MSGKNKKGKVQIHGAKPEMPAFLQRMKEQIVANEDNERREQSEKRRRDRSKGSTDPDDDPTIVKLNDGDLTEAEYKKMKIALETQYKISGSGTSKEDGPSEELDIDFVIKNIRPLKQSRDRVVTSSSSKEPTTNTPERRDAKNTKTVEQKRQVVSNSTQKVLSYGSSSDESD